MSYLIYNNGNNIIYLTSEKEKSLEKEYFRSLGREKTDMEKVLIASKETDKYLQNRWDFFEEVLLKMDENERKLYSKFYLEGTDAQKEIYELLWQFCKLHRNCKLAKRGITGEPVVPTTVDIWLPATFGENLYLIEEKKILKGLKYSTSYTSIHVPIRRIKAIQGDFESFQIDFSAGYALKISAPFNAPWVDIDILSLD